MRGGAAGLGWLFLCISPENVFCDDQPRPLLWEPPSDRYFGPPEELWPVEVDRIRDISQDDFERRVRHGSPFIVEDAGRGSPFLGKDCTWYHQQFPKAKMRAEYTGNGPSRFISLGGDKWFNSGRKTKPPRGHLAHGKSDFNAPYVWHVKDGGDEAPPVVRAEIQRLWRPAYFLKGAVNLREANESQEFWFSLRNGSVMAHADTYCIPAVSLQLRGVKQWHLMGAPPPILGVAHRYDAHDGGLYNTGLWRPMYKATVQEGEALIFFPGQFHETFVPEAGNPQCTVATTFQFQHPVPVRYINAFLPTLSNSHLYYEGHCKDLWHAFSTFEPPGQLATQQDLEEVVEDWPASIDEQAVRQRVEHLFSAIDADKDGGLSADELQAFLAAPERRWARWFLTEDYYYDWRPRSAEEKKSMSREMLEVRAKDTLAYHDFDADLTVTFQELFQSILRWNVVHHKVKSTSRLRKNRKKLAEVERQYDRFRAQPYADREHPRSHEL